MEWANEMKTDMDVTNAVTTKSVASAADALRRHDELQVEIGAREDNFTSLMEAGSILIQQQHYANREVCLVICARCYKF